MIVTTTELAENFVFAYLAPNDFQERKHIGVMNADDQTIGHFYKLNDQILCCCVNATCNLDSTELNKAAEAVINTGDTETEFIILTSRHKRTLVDAENYEMMENDTVTKILKTSAWNKTELLKDRNFLAQPNVLSGFPAALLSLAELKHKSGLLVCSFVETGTIDSRSLQGFKTAFKQLRCCEFQAEDISMKRLKQRSQSNSTLYT